MNRKLYRKVAKKYGITAAEVKSDIQTAINAAYENPDRDLINIKTQNAIPRKGDVPTTHEVIRYAAREVRRREREK